MDPDFVREVRDALAERGKTLDSLSHDDAERFCRRLGVAVPDMHRELARPAGQTRSASADARQTDPLGGPFGVVRVVHDPGVWSAVRAIEQVFQLPETGSRQSRFHSAIVALESRAQRAIHEPGRVHRDLRPVDRQLRKRLDAAKRDYADRVARTTAARAAVKRQREAVGAAR